MSQIKVALPSINEDSPQPFAVRDWARGNGAWLSDAEYDINGKKQKSGIGWSRHSGIFGKIKCRDMDGGVCCLYAGFREYTARLYFKNPEQNEIDVNEKGLLTIKGNIAYYPGRKATGDFQVGKNLDLTFSSDKTELDFVKSRNKPYEAKKSESYEIIVGEKSGYAAKLEGTKRMGIGSIYSDGTKVEEGATVWFLLEPVMAEKLPDGSILTEGMLPVQFETQKKFEKKKVKAGIELDTAEFQIGRVLENIYLELEKSAVVLSEILALQAESP